MYMDIFFLAAAIATVAILTIYLIGSIRMERQRRHNRALAIEAEALRRVKLNAELNAATPLDRRD